jgi:hypothetical protein
MISGTTSVVYPKLYQGMEAWGGHWALISLCSSDPSTDLGQMSHQDSSTC